MLAVHYGNLSHACNQCEYKTSSINHLKQHTLAVHLKVKYPCDKCDYKASDKGTLKKHDLAWHQGVTFECEECDYTAKLRSVLRSHERNKHESRVVCDKCDYAGTTKAQLKHHVLSNHRDKYQYQCSLCDFNSYEFKSFKNHKEDHNISEKDEVEDDLSYEISHEN